MHSTCVTFPWNECLHLAAVSVAITFIEMCRTVCWGTVNCERESRNAEDPYAVALWEGGCYRWPHPLYHFMCVHAIFRMWWCNSMHSNWPKKVFIWFAAGRAGVALYIPIYNTPNSIHRIDGWPWQATWQRTLSGRRNHLATVTRKNMKSWDLWSAKI